jgi:hypothetical protein
MTPEERTKRPERHVVHDCANLVSSWRLRESEAALVDFDAHPETRAQIVTILTTRVLLPKAHA